LSTHRLLDINVTKNVHSTLQQIDPARNLKKWKEQIYTRDVLLLFCMFAVRKDERKLQYIVGVIHIGFINMQGVSKI
jgi:hypothetical protein